MANQVRGETWLTIGGRVLVLKLGLRSLAEIEDEFGAPFDQVLGGMFPRPPVRSMLKFLNAVLRGSGYNPDDPEIRAGLDAMSPIDFAKTAAELFSRSGLGDQVEDDEAGEGSERPLPARNAGGSG